MGFLSEQEVKKILKIHDIPTVKEIFVKTKKDLCLNAEKIGYPVVLKIVSSEVSHKTDIGGVVVNISNRNQLIDEYKKMEKKMKENKIKINGYLLQEYVHGYEMIIGGKQDPQFGPVVLFGSGGIFTEVLGDSSVRICPVTKRDALEMISEIKLSKIFKGFRGEPPVDKNKIADIILKVSDIMLSGIKELDINPLMVSSRICKAVDARIMV